MSFLVDNERIISLGVSAWITSENVSHRTHKFYEVSSHDYGTIEDIWVHENNDMFSLQGHYNLTKDEMEIDYEHRSRKLVSMYYFA